MASFAARFSFVFLALDANPAPVSPSSGTQDAATETMGTVVADSGVRHCPDNAPPSPQCLAPADRAAHRDLPHRRPLPPPSSRGRARRLITI
ncbi:hypothetical protein GCM10023166_15720 [Paeniglutamicibacter cryotolerans]|uniref:Uncharacterized protein n=1 Tax=Paeniglutamicibacter cryotolerans TaxID=670079 RepID=A0A839QID9_9MICC|nr:hypothetical protein [Paeniglutamicibacter cryotolerans]